MYITAYCKTEEEAVQAANSFHERLHKPDVCEVYSPPRVCRWARKHGLTGGWSLDFHSGWDFAKEEDQKICERMLDEDDPWLAIFTPPCGPFSKINQVLNYPMWPAEKVEENLHRGRWHLSFTVRMCRKRMRICM